MSTTTTTTTVAVDTALPAAARRCCPDEGRCTRHGPLSQLGSEEPPSTVGELRGVLRARRAAAAAAAAAAEAAGAAGAAGAATRAPPGTSAELICIGGQQLPTADWVALAKLDIDLDGEVDSCPALHEGHACCPEARAMATAKPKLGLGARFLTVWLLLAAAAGVGIGQIPHVEVLFKALRVGRTNLLVAMGMILMLLPPFASVKYSGLLTSIRQIPKRVGFTSVFTNWVVGPLLMLGLGLATLFDNGALLQGLIFVGAARCIAMVLIWNAFAGGDQLLCVSLVLLNSVITVAAYAFMVILLGLLAGAAGVHLGTKVSFWMVLHNILIYLGVPLAIGVAMWGVGHRCPSYESKFLPSFSHVGLLGLLWTVFWMFAEMSGPLLHGEFPITRVFLAAVPMLVYFAAMFLGTWGFSRYVLRLSREQTITLAFTAASNNFELALAAATALFGANSQQAMGTLMGPVIEIPVMLLMVRAAKCLK